MATHSNLVYLGGGRECSAGTPRTRDVDVFDMGKPDKDAVKITNALPLCT